MRIDPLHNFAVKLQDKTKNAVRRRMLWSEIDVEVADVMFCHGDGLAFSDNRCVAAKAALRREFIAS
ncbi:hypothetical protein ACE04B_41115, partial [Rhizobium phaseoli]